MQTEFFRWDDNPRRKKYLEQQGHAIFGGSKYAYLNYDISELHDKVDDAVKAYYATKVGTAVHAEAQRLISKRIKLTKSTAKFDIQRTLLLTDIPREAYNLDQFTETFVAYVNDAIGFNMRTEELLVPFTDSDWFFGTCDAISFSNATKELHIHDLKTGVSTASMNQLLIYAAFFFLQYDLDPNDIRTELRIYQSGEATIMKPELSDILPVIDRIKTINDYMNSKHGRN